MRVSFLALLWAAAGSALPGTVAAQWPGDVAGRVIDARSGEGIPGARVELPELGRYTTTEATGRFSVRAVEPGRHLLRVAHLAYAPAELLVSVANGRSRDLRVSLDPVVVPLRGIRVTALAGGAAGHRIRVGGEAASAGRTVADVVAEVPGVAVTERGPGAPRTVSIRGSAADAVLVLVDGAPLNDPVTGEADLSLVPLSRVREVTVLPGARSARFGPGARAGVILVTTGPGAGEDVSTGPRAVLGVGSLGLLSGDVTWQGGGQGLAWDASASRTLLDGGFDFDVPASIGGGRGSRANADLERLVLAAGLGARVAGGRGRLRLGAGNLERGLPGRSFAPTPTARQEERHLRAAATWERSDGDARLDLDGRFERRRIRFADAAPPAGLPYDETSRVLGGDLGAVWTRTPPGDVREVALGLDVGHRAVSSPSLEEGGAAHTDAGVFASAVATPLEALPDVEVGGTVRLDRAGLVGRLHLSHDLTVRLRVGPGVVHVAHRSAFSPPTLADQVFREGVGVRPNPDLRGERVPSELEMGVAARTAGAERIELSLGLTAFAGDVEDMIVWAPDFRFVWSPRNVDVRRRGIDAHLRLGTPMASGRLAAEVTWGHARVTHTEPGLEGLQVRYRPRDVARVSAAWQGERTAVEVEGAWTGPRHPVPSEANVLPGFWAVDLSARTGFDVGGWRVTPSLRVDRVLDATDSMIFGFPEPGRTVAVEVAVTPPGSGP